MRREHSEQGAWAREEFGHAELGDSRRTRRLLQMVTRAAQRPAGTVTAVFSKGRERQGAYDFLESKYVNAASLSFAAGRAAAERAARLGFAFVAIDGTSLGLTDQLEAKGFGSVGNLDKGGRGLKVINALGLTPEGIPLGMFSQIWWARRNAKKRTKQEKKNDARRRDAADKETGHWLEAIDEAASRAEHAGAALWFLLDREADGQDVLSKLAATGHRFTVRGSWNRRLDAGEQSPKYLRDVIEKTARKGDYFLNVAASPTRSARCAQMVVRWQRVTLRLLDPKTRTIRLLPVNAVLTREQGTCPVGEEPLDWLLLTNNPVSTLEDARDVIDGYAKRWRVEDLHKAWKTGACNVEQTQLRTMRSVTVWATILASVAVRIERLKLLSRTEPELPATVELSMPEIGALILLKRENKKRNEVIPDAIPSIGQATVWIAELGGYTGKSSGGPPGSITIRRGLEQLQVAARVYAALAPPQK